MPAAVVSPWTSCSPFHFRIAPAPMKPMPVKSPWITRETSLQDNGFWMFALRNHWWYGTDAKLILEFDKLVARLSPAVLQAAARRFLGKDFVLGVLKPEK